MLTLSIDTMLRFATTAMSRVLTCSGMAQRALKYHGMDVHAMHHMQNICTVSVEFDMMVHMSSAQVCHTLHDRPGHVERSSLHMRDRHMELHAHMMVRMHSVRDQILEEVRYCNRHFACRLVRRVSIQSMFTCA